MTAIAIPYYPVQTGLGRGVSSPAARTVDKLAVEAIWHRKNSGAQKAGINDLAAMKEELSLSANTSINDALFNAAARFLLALPSQLPSPEIALDPDGEISFDWVSRNGKSFSVSLGKNGRISFAGRFSTQRSLYGTDRFDEVIPEEVIRAIQAFANS